MGRSNRNVKNGKKYTVYFDTNLRPETEQWIESSKNVSGSINDLVKKFTTGQLVELELHEKEVADLTLYYEKRISDLKELLTISMTQPKIAQIPTIPYVNKDTVVQTNTNISAINSKVDSDNVSDEQMVESYSEDKKEVIEESKITEEVKKLDDKIDESVLISEQLENGDDRQLNVSGSEAIDRDIGTTYSSNTKTKINIKKRGYRKSQGLAFTTGK
ncbi:MAG: hypothetical protein N4A40_12680 [Tissierellales bacterium]|jgi:Txe/YoeB family toxin of Txe-Axe toxin-antitoxin module|nr:hypothetical protein [Tissierellales bacterium]